MKMTRVRHWTTKAQNAFRASLAHCYTMVDQCKTSYLSDLVTLDPSRLPQQNSTNKKSINYLITVLHTPSMELSIAPATCFCVHILTQNFTTKARDAEKLGLTFSLPKTIPCPNGTSPFSLLPILLNSSCPLLQRQNWGHF